MNARQKAKKYKKELQALSAKWMPPIEFKKEEYKVDIIKSDIILDKRLAIDDYKDLIRETVSNDLAQYLVKHFDEYIDYYMEHLPYALKCHFRYQIKVVRRNAESEDICNIN